MAFLRVTGKGTVAGSTIYTVPSGKQDVIIGFRVSNNDTVDHTFSAMIANTYVSGLNIPLPAGSAMDVMIGSKIIAVAGDTIKVFCDADNKTDVYISYME